MKGWRAVLLAIVLVIAIPFIVGTLFDLAGPAKFLWWRTLIFGRGADITLAPVSLPAGEMFFQAEEALKPVEDSMRVGLNLGPATNEKKDAVLQGVLKLADFGDVKVSICKSPTDCTLMNYSGQYFSNDSYGIEFRAHDLDRKARFVGVRLSVDRPLNAVVIKWSNYVQ